MAILTTVSTARTGWRGRSHCVDGRRRPELSFVIAAANSLEFWTGLCGDHTVQTAVAMHPELNLATPVLAVHQPFYPGLVQLVLGSAFIKLSNGVPHVTRCQPSSTVHSAPIHFAFINVTIELPFTSSEIILDR